MRAAAAHLGHSKETQPPPLGFISSTLLGGETAQGRHRPQLPACFLSHQTHRLGPTTGQAAPQASRQTKQPTQQALQPWFPNRGSSAETQRWGAERAHPWHRGLGDLSIYKMVSLCIFVGKVHTFTRLSKGIHDPRKVKSNPSCKWERGKYPRCRSWLEGFCCENYCIRFS